MRSLESMVESLYASLQTPASRRLSPARSTWVIFDRTFTVPPPESMIARAGEYDEAALPAGDEFVAHLLRVYRESIANLLRIYCGSIAQ
jgi:hypothetical protein